MMVDVGLMRSFATAVAADAQALVIDHDNKGHGWIPVAEAVASRRSFAVRLQDDVLAVDDDDPIKAPALWSTAGQLDGMEYPPVVVQSGRPGHLHLFARVPDREQREHFGRILRSQRLDVRSVIRPPLAPHREGLATRIVLPADEQEALERLRPPPRQLPQRIARLLALGDVEGRYPSRSEVVQAITVGFVLAGLSESDLWRAALQPGNLGLEKVREQKDGRAYLRRCWEAAERFTAAHPGLGDREAARDAIEEIWRVALARAWRGKAGLTAFALLRAHVSTAYSLGRRYGYGLSARHAQELAGIASRRTVVNGHRRLVDGGWLRRLAPRGTRGTAQWELCLPEKCRQVNHSVHAPTCTTVSLHGISSDPWLWSALGKAAERSTRSLRLTRSRSRLAHSRTLRDLV